MLKLQVRTKAISMQECGASLVKCCVVEYLYLSYRRSAAILHLLNEDESKSLNSFRSLSDRPHFIDAYC